jgi:hypothetical protein
MKITFFGGLAAFILYTGSAFATLIPIGPVLSTGNGLGAVNSLVTFQNNGTEVGCVGIAGGGSTATGSAQCFGGVTAPGGATDEQTGAGNKTYTASSLGIAATGANTFANVLLVFNGNEGGNAADQAITLNRLSLDLFSPSGALLGAFSTASPYSANAFPGTGNAGFGFQLDAIQAAQANAFLASNPGLVIGASASASNANAGPDTVFISRISTVQPGGGGGGAGDVATPEPTTAWMLGSGLFGVSVFLKKRAAKA